MARRKDTKNLSNKHPELLTNGEVINFLKTLPEARPFGVFNNEEEKPEIFRQLYLPLRSLFTRTTTSSRANCSKIEQISCLAVPDSLSRRFSRWLEDPLDFWETLLEALPRYSGRRAEDRARIFLEGAAHLDTQIDEQRILRRFVAVSAYRLFRRAILTSRTRILNSNIKAFLALVGLPTSETDVENYGDIIRRGERHVSFCHRVEGGDDDAPKNDDEEHLCGGANDYGPLFFSDIPDSM